MNSDKTQPLGEGRFAFFSFVQKSTTSRDRQITRLKNIYCWAKDRSLVVICSCNSPVSKLANNFATCDLLFCAFLETRLQEQFPFPSVATTAHIRMRKSLEHHGVTLVLSPKMSSHPDHGGINLPNIPEAKV